MRPRLFWSFVVLALALKYVGASWDVSSHFRTTQDTANPAHLVNLVGNFVLGIALFTQWFNHRPDERRPLMLAITGMGVVGLAVPLDIGWHKINGLDLTTWSPTHMVLFYGTSLACAGLVLLLLAHVGWRWTSGDPRPRLSLPAWLLLALLLARTLSPLLFPASFNEFAVVAAENLQNGQSVYAVDQTLIDFAAKFSDLPYGDLPHALYPTYTLAMSAAFFVVVRRFSAMPGLALGAAAVYVGGRLASDLVAGSIGFPTSAVPYHVLGAAIVTEVAWLLPARAWFRVAFTGLASTLLAYEFWALPIELPRRVPLDWTTLPWALAATLLVGYAAAALPAGPVLRAGRRMEAWVPAWLVRWTTRRPANTPADALS